MREPIRCVVTGHAPDGKTMVVRDGAPARVAGATADLWHLYGPPVSPDDGGDPADAGYVLEPAPGGVSWRIMDLAEEPTTAEGVAAKYAALVEHPAFDAERPGMHATDTIDFIEILDGVVTLELENSTVDLQAGDYVIQRGTWHHWKVPTGRTCRFSVVMLRSDPGAIGDTNLIARDADEHSGRAPRRVVTGVLEDESMVLHDDEPPNAVTLGGGTRMVELWQTGGAVADPLQGGDIAPPDMQLEPIGAGIAWKEITLPPLSASAGGAMMHRTDTIDFVIVQNGEVWLELPGQDLVRLGPGDTVVQRGTEHAWHNRSDEPVRFSAVMIGAPIGGRNAP